MSIKSATFNHQGLFKGTLLSLKNKPLCLKGLIYLITRATEIIKYRHKGDIETFSLRLNVRPYNKLDKKVADFKECKEELITPHNTKCFHH